MDLTMTVCIGQLYLSAHFRDAPPYKVFRQSRYSQVSSSIMSPYMMATPVWLMILSSTSVDLELLPLFPETPPVDCETNRDTVARACKAMERAHRNRFSLVVDWSMLDSRFFVILTTAYRKHYGPLFKLFGLREPQIDVAGLAEYDQGIQEYEAALLAAVVDWTEERREDYRNDPDMMAIVDAVPNKVRWLTTGNVWMRNGLIPAAFATRPPFLEPMFIQVLGDSVQKVREPIIEVQCQATRRSAFIYFILFSSVRHG